MDYKEHYTYDEKMMLLARQAQLEIRRLKAINTELLAVCEHEVVELANLAAMVDPEQTAEYMSTVYAAIARARGGPR